MLEWPLSSSQELSAINGVEKKNRTKQYLCTFAGNAMQFGISKKETMEVTQKAKMEFTNDLLIPLLDMYVKGKESLS